MKSPRWQLSEQPSDCRGIVVVSEVVQRLKFVVFIFTGPDARMFPRVRFQTCMNLHFEKLFFFFFSPNSASDESRKWNAKHDGTNVPLVTPLPA